MKTLVTLLALHPVCGASWPSLRVRSLSQHGLLGYSWLLSAVMMRERMKMRRKKEKTTTMRMKMKRTRRMTRRMMRTTRRKTRSQRSEGQERSQLHPRGRPWTLTMG